MYRSLVMALAFVLTGCLGLDKSGTTLADLENPTMSGPFDPALSSFVLKPGTATIKGEIMTTGRTGNIVRGAFARVRLIPITPYAREYIEKLFRGAKVYRWGAIVYGVDNRFDQHMRHTLADNDGRFTFFGVPAGSYYVYASPSARTLPFAVYQNITVTDGQTVERFVLNGR